MLSMPQNTVSFEPFQLAEGFFVLYQLSVDGQRPKHDKLLQSLYTQAGAARRRAGYIITTHAASTPFGYFTDARGKAEIERKVSEIRRPMLEMNRIVGAHFRCWINLVFLPVNTEDSVLRASLCQATVDKLNSLKLKLTSPDPKLRNKVLTYSQDSSKRLDLYCTGIYAKTIARVLDHASNQASLLRKKEIDTGDVDLGPIDSAIALFERALAGVSQ